MKLYVIGAGAVGLLHAHYYRKAFSDIILLKRRCQKSKVKVTFTSLVGSIEVSEHVIEPLDGVDTIDSLLICTKAYDVQEVFADLKPRLGRNCNIMLLCNGALEINRRLSHLIDETATLSLGSTSHGVMRTGEYEITHTGQGSTVLNIEDAVVCEILKKAWIDLNFQALSKSEMQEQLIIKLIINCCINPTAGLIGVENSGLINAHGSKLFQEICAEIYPLVKSDLKCNLQTIVGKVLDCCDKTKRNKNSLLVDFKGRNRTEIDFLNGYVVALGEKKGTKTPLNSILHDLVKLKELNYSQ